ncbi:hypothetical protein GSY74_04345 [Sulfurovum sp. bin170]|uniref:hypothetical protein n=1 Tax=Sulfurovum sp. bin170 TaxID=2695268 RepID=UPI0013DF3678|nr:hypothetical protein [Sulfurovum sp. bin170]NEW60505.1 hypothetical protein [Sulfurovum sp. bin170]
MYVDKELNLIQKPKQPKWNLSIIHRIINISNYKTVCYIFYLFKTSVFPTYLKEIISNSKISNIAVKNLLKTVYKENLSNSSYLYLFIKLFGVTIE